MRNHWSRAKYLGVIQSSLSDLSRPQTEEQQLATVKFIRGLLRVAPKPAWRREAIELIEAYE